MGFSFCFIFLHEFSVLVDRYSKLKNAISHKVHELKSSAANDISIISVPIKNLPGKFCDQRKEKIQSKA